MRERPILFSALMVPPIIDRRKRQTRRIMKSQPYTLRIEGVGYPTKAGGFVSLQSEHCLNECPHGVVGDRLWVREGWQTGAKLDSLNATEIAAKCLAAGYPKPGAPIRYGADGAVTLWGDNDPVDFGAWGRKRSSRFMPRWATRLTLQITGLRVERLQEISEADVLAEGIELVSSNCDGECGRTPCGISRSRFSSLWDSINGADAWQANPWVWVITFKLVQP
jgi:hypothetical protein